MRSSKIKKQEEFYPDEIVDIKNEKEKQTYEGKIMEIKGDIIIVQNMQKKKVEKYKKDERKILKLWGPLQPLQKYNRVDFELNNTGYWVEAIVLDINNEKNEILLKYKNNNRFKPICETWINLDTNYISPLGFHTKYNNIINSKSPLSLSLSTSNINNLLGIKRKNKNNDNNITLNEEQELKFRELMKKNNLEIKAIEGDGNCLFRAVSDQVYGKEEYHDIIRQKCMDYLEIQKRFFKLFIDGDFNEYIKEKRKDGAWGDDIELEALSEIYNRPIEIYSGSEKPLRCFHEDKNDYDRNVIPIRLSYHGRKHYNSVIPLKDAEYKFKMYIINLIQTNPGVYEEKIIKIAKDNEDNLEKGIKLSEEEEYLEKLKKYLYILEIL